jgi:hypothetical protein
VAEGVAWERGAVSVLVRRSPAEAGLAWPREDNRGGLQIGFKRGSGWGTSSIGQGGMRQRVLLVSADAISCKAKNTSACGETIARGKWLR